MVQIQEKWFFGHENTPWGKPPKIGGKFWPPKSSIKKLGFSIMFTIHFGDTIIFGNTQIVFGISFCSNNCFDQHEIPLGSNF